MKMILKIHYDRLGEVYHFHRTVVNQQEINQLEEMDSEQDGVS